MKHTEKNLENECCKFARGCGLAAVKLENVKGIPDRMFIKDGGDCIFVEFKKPNQKGIISSEQLFWGKFLKYKFHVINDFETFKVLINSFISEN